MFLEKQIVGIGPVDAADLINIAETVGDDQCRLGAGALQDRVDGEGGAVQEDTGVGKFRIGLGDSGLDAFHQCVGRRQRLAQPQPAGCRIKRRDIGKCAADIGSQPQFPGSSGRLCHVKAS